MEDNRGSGARDISSARPFEKSCFKYWAAGYWPIPVPYREKFPPPTGFTGRRAEWADENQIKRWIAESNWNVALHLGAVPPPEARGVDLGEDRIGIEWVDVDGNPLWEVMALDVDDYLDGSDEKRKKGGAQLAEMEARLGPLPKTWISTSRGGKGLSGIRYFLVPVGYSFRGKAADNIDVIQRVHRYSVVWPSYHPKGGLYQWWKNGAKASIPRVWDLPQLPQAWIDELTNGGMRELGGGNDDCLLDMTSSVSEIERWAEENFGVGWVDGTESVGAQGITESCALTRKRVTHWTEEIAKDPSSHDKILEAHWNLLCMAAEGHGGWQDAVKKIEEQWVTDVTERRKRGLKEAKREVWRSRINALRKLKGTVDQNKRRIVGRCGCYIPPGDLGGCGNGGPAPIGEVKDPGDYLPNHRGNGEHFIDLYGHGNWRYVEEIKKWMYWTEEDHRWRFADNDIVRRAFGLVHDRQMHYVKYLKRKLAEAQAAENAPKVALFKAMIAEWKQHALNGGNTTTIDRSLNEASCVDGVRVSAEKLDARPDLLGVKDGVLELKARYWDALGQEHVPETPCVFRQATREDLVTKTTGLPHSPLEWQQFMEKEAAEGKQTWNRFLETFLPDPNMRAWVQQVVGHALYGENLAKQVVFLYGPSDTGKTTFLNTISEALGEYASAFDITAFNATSRFNPTIIRSIRQRMISTTEVSDQSVSAEKLKQISGNDPMSSEIKNSMEVFEGTPSFVVFIGTNHPPEVQGNDPALRDRIVVLPFVQQVPRSSLGSAMPRICARAALAWMIDGWALYVKHNLQNKPSETEEERRFHSEMKGDAAAFVDECLDVTNDQEDYETVGFIYSVYCAFARENGIQHPWNNIAFGKKLTKAGIEFVKGKRIDGKMCKIRRGIKVKKEWKHRSIRNFTLPTGIN